MPDHAFSADAAVQAQLDRLWALSPGADILGLGRITRLLARIGDPHRRLPPVFHVAGTNGKGSTCAFVRAALEAQGYRVHAYTSPHLVRFNERIRLAGALIEDTALAPLLREVLDAGGDIGASFFEVTTAAAFLAFTRVAADACVIEVGLGGRLDATNVVTPLVAGIAALGIDHQSFLGDTLEAIAAEKAGIAKHGAPLVTAAYPAPIARIVADTAAAAGATHLPAGEAWRCGWSAGRGAYRDGQGVLSLPAPALPGPHQRDNFALAVAMLRHQQALPVMPAAIDAAARDARWPARFQRLGAGPLTARIGADTPLWLDGGHNASAGEAIGHALPAVLPPGRSLALVAGMLANKDPRGFLTPFADRIGMLAAVPIPGHAHHDPATLAGIARGLGIPLVIEAASPGAALDALAVHRPPAVLIAGTLYLAGEVLAENGELPT